MDACAELTLRLVRAAQEALKPRSSLLGWHFFPEGRKVTWPEAREILAAAPKPLLVAPLVEPGTIAFWSIAALPSRGLGVSDSHFANGRQFFGERLEWMKLTDADFVEAPDGEFRVSVADFKQWLADYTVPIGIGMNKSPRPHTARITVRLPGGGGPPVGWVDEQRPANEEL